MRVRLELVFSVVVIFVCFQSLPSAAVSESKVIKLRINGGRLIGQIEKLSEFGRNPQGGIERVAFSEADISAREYMMTMIRNLGLKVHIDEAGNIMSWKAGSDPKLPPILFGSHIDTVPNGGTYDGALGVLAALECFQTLDEKKIITRHPLENVIFSDEEGGSIGSLAMIGELPPASLETVSQSGKTVRDGIRVLGGNPDAVSAAARRTGEIRAYLELHIEQGGRLDSLGKEIGVVEGIVGIHHWEVRIEGVSNHAGTTPMNVRQDALLAASYLIIAVNRAVTAIPGDQVGTVGKIGAEPGAANVIPGLVVLTLELRDLSEDKIQKLYQEIRKEALSIEQKTGTRIAFNPLEPASHPAPSDPRVRSCIAQAAGDLGHSTIFLPSGAGHDAQNLARIAPMGMIFVPSVKGISHSPKEYSRPEDIERGANVLLQTILRIDEGCLEDKPR